MTWPRNKSGSGTQPDFAPSKFKRLKWMPWISQPLCHVPGCRFLGEEGTQIPWSFWPNSGRARFSIPAGLLVPAVCSSNRPPRSCQVHTLRLGLISFRPSLMFGQCYPPRIAALIFLPTSPLTNINPPKCLRYLRFDLLPLTAPTR